MLLINATILRIHPIPSLVCLVCGVVTYQVDEAKINADLFIMKVKVLYLGAKSNGKRARCLMIVGLSPIRFLQLT